MRSASALRIISGNLIFRLGFQKSADFWNPFFHAEGRNRKLHFSVLAFPVKMQSRADRSLPGIALSKIILPLYMRRAEAERIPIVWHV